MGSLGLPTLGAAIWVSDADLVDAIAEQGRLHVEDEWVQAWDQAIATPFKPYMIRTVLAYYFVYVIK